MLLTLTGEKNRVFGLDLMRAVAILLVVFGHIAWIYPTGNGIVFQLMALSGYMGVEVFFVLSGYLIGRILLRLFAEGQYNGESFFGFLRRRWFRTLPNYFLILGVNVGIATWIGYEIEGLWQYFLFLQNFAHPLLPFFPESWSLSVEEFAYVVLPLSLLMGESITKSRKIGFLAVVLLLCFGCMLARLFYHYSSGTTTLEYWNIALKSVVVFRLDAIFYGVICAWLHRHFPDLWLRIRWIAFTFGVVLLGFFTVGVGALGLVVDRYPFFWNVLYLPLTSLSIACFLPVLSLWRKARSFISHPITFISLISYSIYLLHYSVILQLLKHFIDTESLEPVNRHLFTAGYLLLTLFCSALLYRFFEKPMMDLRDPKANSL